MLFTDPPQVNADASVVANLLAERREGVTGAKVRAGVDLLLARRGATRSGRTAVLPRRIASNTIESGTLGLQGYSAIGIADIRVPPVVPNGVAVAICRSCLRVMPCQRSRKQKLDAVATTALNGDYLL